VPDRWKGQQRPRGRPGREEARPQQLSVWGGSNVERPTANSKLEASTEGEEVPVDTTQP